MKRVIPEVSSARSTVRIQEDTTCEGVRMQKVPHQPLKYESIILTGLALFGLSIALSKSANNILIGLLCLFALALASLRPSFRTALLQHARQPLLLPLAVLMSVALVGLIFTSNFSDGIGIVNKLGGLLLAYLVVSVLLDMIGSPVARDQNAEQVLLAFLVGIFALDIIGVMTYLGFVANRKYFLPLSALNVFHIWFANLNAIGLYAAAGFLLFSPTGKDRRARVFLILLLALAIFSILFSLSRTAWFGMLVTMIVLSFFLIKKKIAFSLAMVVLLIAGIMLYLFNSIVHTRIDLVLSDVSSYSQGQANTNVGARFLMWKAAFRMFLSNPLFGVGTGDYVLTMNRGIASGELPEFLHYFNQPHNMYLFALATNGLPGLAALLFVFYSGLRATFPVLLSPGRNRLFAFLAVATAVHYLAAGMTDSLFNIQILRYTFAFIMGVCVRSSLLHDADAGSGA